MAVLNNFDQNNPQYKIGRIHIVTLARIISVILVLGTFINLIYAFTRTSTVIFYSFVIVAFAAGIYGTLLYGVYKEKRHFLIPFMIFQSVYLIIAVITLVAFIILTLFSNQGLSDISRDFLGLDIGQDFQNLAHVRVIAVIFIGIIAIYIFVQFCFLHVIRKFNAFLRDREGSFNFTMEPEFS